MGKDSIGLSQGQQKTRQKIPLDFDQKSKGYHGQRKQCRVYINQRKPEHFCLRGYSRVVLRSAEYLLSLRVPN